ncbi:hypothetical protein RFI_02291 [Reticulomyxa filosa]|uniref:Uncharacterized protein n=1 Tax=Reticulomyxa filosa TaxID=46433 RepID=X6P9P7_RETFI|nr:hypothetical protein RFI_02291 [Reticulomyxa filosa]|eukprot:ETO34794.1 hypothetical protein RFI_02291 [Reticulomyxa filosa]
MITKASNKITVIDLTEGKARFLSSLCLIYTFINFDEPLCCQELMHEIFIYSMTRNILGVENKKILIFMQPSPNEIDLSQNLSISTTEKDANELKSNSNESVQVESEKKTALVPIIPYEETVESAPDRRDSIKEKMEKTEKEKTEMKKAEQSGGQSPRLARELAEKRPLTKDEEEQIKKIRAEMSKKMDLI